MITPRDILAKIIEIHDRRVYEQRVAEADEKAFEILQENFAEDGDELLDWLYEHVPVVPDASPCVYVNVESEAPDGLVIISPYRDKYTRESSSYRMFYPFRPLYQNNYLVRDAAQSILDELLVDIIASFEYPDSVQASGDISLRDEVKDMLGGVPSFDEVMAMPTGNRDDAAGGTREFLLASDGDSDYMLLFVLGWGMFCESGKLGSSVDDGVTYNDRASVSLYRLVGGNTVMDEYEVRSDTLYVGMSDEQVMEALYDILWS